MNDNLIPLQKLSPFLRFCCTIGHLPSSYMLSLTYEEQLLWLCQYLEKTVIPAINNNAEATEECQKLIAELKYKLDHLDLQDAVNNRLDEMVADGSLAEIINQEVFGELKLATFPATYFLNKNLVVFGDSFSQPQIPNSEDEQWVKRVVQATGMNKFNFAIAGAGFARENNDLSSQLTTAINSMSITEKQNTSVVIVYAGYNDIMNNVSSDTILANCITLMNNIHSTFPNAKIILAPFNWQYGSLSIDNNITIETLINRMSRDLSNLPVTTLKLARYWLLGVQSYFRNANHPSVAGYNQIASQFINAIFGGSEHVQIGGRIIPSHGNENVCNFTFEDGIVNFNFGVKFDTDIEDYSGEQFENLHALLVPEKDMIIPLYAVDGYKGTLRLSNNGKGYLRNITVPADTWLLANVTFRPQAWKAYNVEN